MGWTAFMQGGAAPHTRIRQEVLTSAATAILLWPARNPDISIIKNVWSVMLRVSMVSIHCRKMQLSFMQRAQWMTEHHIGARTTISGQHSLPNLCLGRSSRWTYSLSRNSWMEFWSSHYLRVRFVLRLMLSIHTYIDPCFKTYNVRKFYPIKAYKNYFAKKWKLFLLNNWENSYIQ